MPGLSSPFMCHSPAHNFNQVSIANVTLTHVAGKGNVSISPSHPLSYVLYVLFTNMLSVRSPYTVVLPFTHKPCHPIAGLDKNLVVILKVED